METKFMRTMPEGYIIIVLSPQKNCVEACHEKYKPSILPTKPGKEADEESDPRRPRPSGVSPRPPRPSGVSPRPPRPSGVSPRPPRPSRA
ncbi:vegetative cell wall protein gp1-like [Orbicella faveolata]|uniref:vegetative cell wall protein gp1-like n=1 Tax=Orbicella faveolata TaxID=48498 RepID=UPI0009E56AC9|nr:vegetative cell wall protein gp1-like [Orbicella faveolata]